MKIVLLGPPGAGKGTQAQELKDKLGVKHISTGDIFRDLIKSGSKLGKDIKEYVEKGELVPNRIVVKIVAQTVENIDLNKGFVLDGFPRTKVQAEMLDSTLGEKGISIDKVFYFETSEDVIIRRLSGRKICSECGATYHAKNMPPKVDNICDLCGSRLHQRKDDEPGTVRNRLKIYRDQTEDLIDYYKKLNILDTIDGDLSKDEAFKVLQGKLLSLDEYNERSERGS